ncbi:hypothetical protein BDN67DRAFT_1067587 [Paxillus ammoniavirescens]|nr:hypothetical protein BDN67DRAFT_1067587 [Paxillus ammoniavirescens]
MSSTSEVYSHCSTIECSAEKEVFPLIATLGIDCLFQAPLLALQAAMPMKDVATASSGFMFLRTVGGTVGIAIGEAIISTILPKKLSGIANISSLTFGDSAAALNDSVSKIHLIPSSAARMIPLDRYHMDYVHPSFLVGFDPDVILARVYPEP